MFGSVPKHAKKRNLNVDGRLNTSKYAYSKRKAHHYLRKKRIDMKAVVRDGEYILLRFRQSGGFNDNNK